MKTIARFRTPEEAHLLRTALEDSEIRAGVLDEHVIQWFWYYSDAIGGVRVVVSDEDRDAAVGVYRERVVRMTEDPPPLIVAKAWFLVLIISCLIGAPALIFGQREVEP